MNGDELAGEPQQQWMELVLGARGIESERLAMALCDLELVGEHLSEVVTNFTEGGSVAQLLNGIERIHLYLDVTKQVIVEETQ